MLLVSLSLLAPPAAALDVDTFSFAGAAFDGQRGLQVEDPGIGWPQAAYGGLGVVYARNPLVQIYTDGSSSALVQDSFATHLLGGYTLLGKVRFDLDLPIYPYVGGADVSGFAAGDARLQGVVPIPLGADSPVGVAIIPMLTLPIGQPKSFTGSGAVGGGLTAALGVEATDALSIDANLGFHATRASAFLDQQIGSGLDLGLGLSYAVTPVVTLGAELDGKVDMAGGLGTWTDNPLELHGYGRYGKASGVQALLGVGTGLVGGVGAPEVRVLAGLGYRAAGKEPDRDQDGIPDSSDACIDTPEDHDNFEDEDGCPEADNDKDGLVDRVDQCPNEPEDDDGFADDDGCPDPDNDHDSVLDADDQCPIVPGTVAMHGCPDRDGDQILDDQDACPDDAGPPETNGCPDRDKDLVPDNRDKCPDEPRDPREDPARSDGCPHRVFVSVERIEILDKIYFDTNKTTIKKESFPLLAEIAKVINDNPDIERIEVAGHTDSVGNDKANLKLSQGRAESVVKHLSTIGKVDASRLVPIGYGEMKPIDSNESEAGRGNNRRVEFVIKAFGKGRPPVGPANTPAPQVLPGAPHGETPGKPAEPAKPAEPPKPAEPAKPAEPPKPEEKPVDDGSRDPWGGQ